MTVMPAIARELRAQSRQGFTYGLRVIGAAVLLAVATLFGVNSNLSQHEGGALFGDLNTTLFICIWVLAPLLAADCISRERREGTLGLLFLTPLKARDVVLAKGFVHGLRALTLWLAALPILMIPFVVGGVSWREAVLSVLVNFSALCLALACGLLASAFSKSWLRAQIAAFLLACGLSAAFAFFAGFLVVVTAGAASGSVSVNRIGNVSSEEIMMVGYYAVTDFGGEWGQAFAWMGASGSTSWLRTECWVALVSLLGFFLTVELAAGRLRRIWQDEPPSARRQWLANTLTTPIVAVSFLHGWMRRKLDRNPIGWLEQRTWSGRLVTWSWFAAMIGVYSVLLGDLFGRRAIYNLQQFMAWLLLVGLASSSAGSFQRERETGVMELLLVSPMSISQIIGGRLRGLWGQFIPAMALLIIVWLYFRTIITMPGDLQWLQIFVGAFVSVPVVGLYYSLKRKVFLTAFLATIFTALMLPFVCQWLFQFACYTVLGMFGIDYYPRNVYLGHIGGGGYPNELIALLREFVSSSLFVTICQLVITVRIGKRLYRDMEHRNFTFVRVIN